MPKETFYNLPEEKRKLIINVAIEEFAAHPFQTASISDIVRKAGIAKGSFYQYFEDKQDLYHYLIEFGTQEKLALMKQFSAADPGSDLFGYFRWLFQSAVIFEFHQPLLARISYRAFVEDVPFSEMTEELRRRGTTQFFKQLLSQGILHGEISPWVDVDTAAFMMETAYYQFGKYFADRLGLEARSSPTEAIFESDEAQYLITNLIEIFQTGLKPKTKI
jgi:AcrR family transcriptional regulator